MEEKERESELVTLSIFSFYFPSLSQQRIHHLQLSLLSPLRLLQIGPAFQVEDWQVSIYPKCTLHVQHIPPMTHTSTWTKIESVTHIVLGNKTITRQKIHATITQPFITLPPSLLLLCSIHYYSLYYPPTIRFNRWSNTGYIAVTNVGCCHCLRYLLLCCWGRGRSYQGQIEISIC